MVASKLLVLSFVSALVAAASVPSSSATSGLSSSCQSTISSILSNKALNQCLDTNDLLPFLSLNEKSALIPPIDTWLHGYCAAQDCSNSTITTLISSIKTGCATDLASAGVSSDQLDQATTVLESFFQVDKTVLCLANTSKFCLTQILTDVQSITGGTLSVDSIFSAGTVPQSVECSTCVEAIYVAGKKAVGPPYANDPTVTGTLTSACGASFAAATTLPQGIFEASGPAVSKIPKVAAPSGDVVRSTNGALHATAWSASASLVVVGSLFALL